jgi:hypothetical protein
LREFNRQYRIFPFLGLKEIIEKKKDFEKLSKIDFTHSMLLQKKKQEELEKMLDASAESLP